MMGDQRSSGAHPSRQQLCSASARRSGSGLSCDHSRAIVHGDYLHWVQSTDE